MVAPSCAATCVILAGTHRELRQFIPAGPLRSERVAQLAQRRKPRPRLLGVSASGGIVINPAEPHAARIRLPLQELVGLTGGNAGLVTLLRRR